MRIAENTLESANVACIVVTYGSRDRLCKSVCSRLIEIGVGKIFLVDNGCSESAKAALQHCFGANESVVIISNTQNLGSSGGIALGLEYAFIDRADFVWILDDDNLPESAALERLLASYQFLSGETNEVVLYSSRAKDRPRDKAAFIYGREKRYYPNSFCGFSLMDLIGWRIYRASRSSGSEIRFPIAKVDFGPYGGMFARLETFEKIGVPRREYFVYADDHEYSSRFCSLGIPQYVVESSRINDIDQGPERQGSYEQNVSWFSSETSQSRIYYTVRNHTHLTLSNIESRTAFLMNFIFYILLHWIRGWRHALKNPANFFRVNKVVFRAISDARANRLGFNPTYKIANVIPRDDEISN